MDKFFSVFGKVALVLIILGVIAGGAFYLGKNLANQSPKEQTPSTIVTPSTQPVTPTERPTGTTLLSPTAVTKKSIAAGVLPFTLYLLTFPQGWLSNEQKVEATGTDKLTLTKNGYVLTISQGAGGGGSCLYGSEPPQEMAQHFDNFVGITGVDKQYRRGTSDNKTFTICEKKDAGFGFPTSYGYITYTTPTPNEDTILIEMDLIVASILKQH